MNFEVIIDLEKKLLDPNVRKNHTELDLLLSDDFIEFGASGKVYKKSDILTRLPQEDGRDLVPKNFVPLQLAPDVIQLRFKLEEKNDNGHLSFSLRSSIWRLIDGQWRMIFHQGTKINN